MKVLFVDDEEQVLLGIQRSLFHLDDWDLEFCTSATDALELLDEEAFDVVVSDMKMPGMDGAEFLSKVHASHPRTVRMVLTGEAGEEAAMRTLGVAHQFLAKPCGQGTLENAILKTHRLQTRLHNDKIIELVGRVPSLSSPPRVYIELARMTSTDDVDLRAVGDLIESDPALCAKLLQIVNSAFFSRGAPTTDVHNAVLSLGVNTIKSVVVYLEALAKLSSTPNVPGFSLKAQWEHAARSAELAAFLSPTATERNDTFVAAKLHDIGKWVMAAEAPDMLLAASELAEAEEISFHEAETQLQGVSHAEIGAYLLGLWCLPERVVDAVANHHSPEQSEYQEGFSLAHILRLTDRIQRGEILTDEELARAGSKRSAEELQNFVETTES